MIDASTESRRFEVVGVGQCSLDFLGRIDDYPPVDQKAELEGLTIQGGGPVATALVTLARLGVSTAFVGQVGSDDFGRQIGEGLETEGVDCAALRTVKGATSQVAFVSVEKGTARRNIFWHRGSTPPLRLGADDLELVSRCRVVHLDGLQLEASLAATVEARRHKVTTVLDGGTLRPGVERLLPHIDHLVVSERFARQFGGACDLGAIAVDLLQFGAASVTVTSGALGCLSVERGGNLFSQPAFAVEAVDTTGCGDVFHGGYIYGLLQRWSLRRTIRFAAACAALKARALGGRTAIPRLSEVEMLLRGDTDNHASALSNAASLGEGPDDEAIDCACRGKD